MSHDPINCYLIQVHDLGARSHREISFLQIHSWINPDYFSGESNIFWGVKKIFSEGMAFHYLEQ